MTAKQNKLFAVFFVVLSIAIVFVAAKSERASGGAVIEALAVAIGIALAIGGVYAVLHWLRPRWFRKFSSFADASAKDRGGCLAAIPAVLVFLAVSKWAFTLLEYLLISHAYGYDAWAGGARVIDKRGGLSDGGSLSGAATIALYMVTFILSGTLMIGTFLLFRYIGYRLRGRRWSNSGA
jgi:hypothetical protein